MSPLNITQPLDSIRYMVYNGYYKVMFNIPKMGHLPTPVEIRSNLRRAPIGATRGASSFPPSSHQVPGGSSSDPPMDS